MRVEVLIGNKKSDVVVLTNEGGLHNTCWVDERKLILRVEYKGRKYRGEESCILYPDEREIANVIKNAYAKALNEVDIQKGQQKLEKQKKCLSGCTTKKGAAYDICINDCKRIYGGTK